jgi:type IV pilus biogenesis protein CpaD/CtpE
MKKYIVILALTTLCCCAVKETDQGTQKKLADYEATTWTLRAQKDSLLHVIIIKDSLMRECGCSEPAR